jgi:hypothetical protein
MKEVSDVYALTEHIHAAFFEPGILEPEEIAASDVESKVGSSSSPTTQRIEAFGFVDNRVVTQTLARSKYGIYHLSTTFITYRKRVEQTCIQPRSDEKVLEALLDSLFMQKLIAIAFNRQILTKS